MQHLCKALLLCALVAVVVIPEAEAFFGGLGGLGFGMPFGMGFGGLGMGFPFGMGFGGLGMGMGMGGMGMMGMGMPFFGKKKK